MNRSFVLNVTDFGADPTGQHDSTLAFKNAIFEANKSNPHVGGVVCVPGGIFKMSETIQVQDFVTLMGAGSMESTILDYGGQTKGPGLIVSSDFGHCGIEGLQIQNTFGNGIEINAEPGPGHNRNFCHVRDVCVKDSRASGFVAANSYMTTFERCWARDAREDGFRLSGFHTSIKLDTCNATACGNVGFNINGTVYSTLNNCGADSSGSYGYFLTNCQCIVMTGCGAEESYYSSVGMAATAEWALNKTSAQGELRGITITSCFSMNGNKSGDPNFGEYLTLFTADKCSIQGSSHNHFSLTGTQSPVDIVKRGDVEWIDFPVVQGAKVIG